MVTDIGLVFYLYLIWVVEDSFPPGVGRTVYLNPAGAY